MPKGKKEDESYTEVTQNTEEDDYTADDDETMSSS